MILYWTVLARDDLRSIHGHIAKDSKTYAKRMVDRIKKAVRILKRFPRIGSMVEEWNLSDHRELVVGNYRIIYRIMDKTVQILTVLHGARNLPARDMLEPGSGNGQQS